MGENTCLGGKSAALGDVCAMKEVNATKTCGGIHVWKKILPGGEKFKQDEILGGKKIWYAQRVRNSI